MKRSIYGLKTWWIWSVLLCIGTSPVISQDPFDRLDPVDMGYRKLMKTADQLKRPVMAILYSDQYAANTTLQLTDDDDLSLVRDSMITNVIDWSRKSNHRLVRRENVRTNPYFLILHPDGTILKRSQGFSESSMFLDFARQGLALYFRLEILLEKYRVSGDEQSIKDLMAFYNHVKDIERVEETVETYLKKYKGTVTRDDLKYLFEVAKECLCSPALEELFNQNKDQVLSFTGEKSWLEYKQGLIISELSKGDLLNPPNVWHWYELEFGPKADSLYRLFAISYFRHVEPDMEILLDEVYEFLYYYKDTPWEKQDELYLIALENSTDRTDLELLLDLISYHYFKDKNYRNMDFRAAILHKLGQEERALGMMEEVMALALEEGIRYQSLLHTLKKD